MIKSHTRTVLATIVTVIVSMPGIDTHSIAERPIAERRTPTTPQIVENEVLVKYVNPTIPPTGEELKYKMIARYPRSGVVRFKLPPQVSVENAIRELKKNSNVQRARPNYRIYGHIHNTYPPNDEAWLSHFPVSGHPVSGLPKLWGLEKIGMKKTWDLSTGGIRGGNSIIAVLDTGIDHNHPDLNLNMWSGIGITFIAPNDNACSQKPQPSDSMDHDGHGTHVAGIVAARGNNQGQDSATSLVGVNWEAKLMAVKIMCNIYPTGYISDAVEGIYYAVVNHATVILGAWGFPAAGLLSRDIDDLSDAITYARGQNVLYVASAGNNYADLSTIVMYPQHFSHDNIIVVAAADPQDRLWWDKPVTQTSAGSNYGLKVHLAAPGENILSTFPSSDIAVSSGTSMAAAHVAGCAALLQAKRKITHPTSPLSPATLKDILLTSADPKTSLDAWVPSGRELNCHKALQELIRRSVFQDLTPPGSPTNLSLQ